MPMQKSEHMTNAITISHAVYCVSMGAHSKVFDIRMRSILKEVTTTPRNVLREGTLSPQHR
jgi:hypothetical protein